MSGCWQVEMEQQKKFKSDNDNAVSLLTIHRSKGAHLHPPLQAAGFADSICRGGSGLEWKVVFVIKMNEGELPMSFDQQELERAKESSALQEERRLCFVAWSRASTRLYLSYRCQGDKSEPLNPSRYINDIQRDHVKKLQWDEYEREGGEGEAAAAAGGGSCDPADHSFVKRFPQEQRQTVSHLFNTWSKKVRRRSALPIRLAGIADGIRAWARRRSRRNRRGWWRRSKRRRWSGWPRAKSSRARRCVHSSRGSRSTARKRKRQTHAAPALVRPS